MFLTLQIVSTALVGRDCSCANRLLNQALFAQEDVEGYYLVRPDSFIIAAAVGCRGQIASMTE